MLKTLKNKKARRYRSRIATIESTSKYEYVSHCKKRQNFPLRISLVNVNKSTESPENSIFCAISGHNIPVYGLKSRYMPAMVLDDS